MKFTYLLCLLGIALRLGATPVDEMASAARQLIAALNDGQRSQATFAFEADERENWHFVPKDRKGLPLKEMTAAQRHLAYALLSTGLSQRGYVKAVTIMSLEQILQEMEGPARRFPRDPELYYVSIFGEPTPTGTWGWRVEGHHLSVNFTLNQGTVVGATPSFLGTNPGEVRSGPRAGLRVLAAEEDLARELVTSLNDEQRSLAVIDTKAPDDILTLAARKVEPLASAGLPLSRLDSKQKELAVRLAREYLGRLRGELADADFARIEKAGIDSIHFAWAGGLQRGARHYYRLQGPTFIFEYDNTQNDANHIHAVWREFQGDFGRDVLARHLQSEHGK
jgi:Protein of unknown function (DUF3500)